MNSKYSLKPKEISDIKRFVEHSGTAFLIREHKKWQSFKVGDVLIRTRAVLGDSDWRVDVVSITCPVPKKFKIVHIDELGVPWIKQMSVRGGLGSKLYCLAESSQTLMYEMDPEIITATILGDKYDPRAQYKSWRDNNPQYGGKS